MLRGGCCGIMQRGTASGTFKKRFQILQRAQTAVRTTITSTGRDCALLLEHGSVGEFYGSSPVGQDRAAPLVLVHPIIEAGVVVDRRVIPLICYGVHITQTVIWD